eukprot:TRINITY_DN4379_c0_g5_i2.p1 TRINITY_DN4379_c0_g5~~TRINITY_DN4379_c0_g5_i2.p1  ORF type:complete len:556 (-),score=172.63 TRINITY_DN4379_c0_g5_i2:50-1717(-)
MEERNKNSKNTACGEDTLLRVLALSVVLLAAAVGCVALLSQQPPGAGLPEPVAERLHRRYASFFPNWEATLDEKREFVRRYSQNGEYGYNGQIDHFVLDELPRMRDQVYLDYTGAGVYQDSQLRGAMAELLTRLYGNAHSRNPSALRTEREMEAARDMVLRHFHTTRKEYSVIFTSGTTGALKLLGESFPWTNASKFVYLRQNHNSVLGIREIALDQGAEFVAIPESEMNDETCNVFIGGDPCAPASHRRSVILTNFPETTYNLFAFPAEDNFAGVKYPLEWVNMFKQRRRGEDGTGVWLTLLDAAAFVPCNDLDLTKYPAHFVTVSFYKMFGYPTGIGALLVRNDVTDIMQKTFFGGGTVVLSACDTHFCLLQQRPCTRFEDGTPSFLSIAELKYGFGKLETLGMDNISRHVSALTQYLYDEMFNMRHSNGRPVFSIYGKHHLHDPSVQGSIVNFNAMDADGQYIGYSKVQDRTAAAGFHLRTGCNCNPGACFDYLSVSSADVQKYSLEKTSCSDDMDLADGKPLGGVRVSLGYLSSFEDVAALLGFLRREFAK